MTKLYQQCQTHFPSEIILVQNLQLLIEITTTIWVTTVHQLTQEVCLIKRTNSRAEVINRARYVRHNSLNDECIQQDGGIAIVELSISTA